jgi:hypothetical protein
MVTQMPYTAEYDKAIESAIKVLEDGSIDLVAAAARKHNVSNTTLHGRMKGQGTLFSRYVQGKKLSNQEEKGLCILSGRWTMLVAPLDHSSLNHAPIGYRPEITVIQKLCRMLWARSGRSASSNAIPSITSKFWSL